MAESDIFFAKSGADQEAAIQNWLRRFFAEISPLFCPKNALQYAPEKPVVKALFGKLVRANADCNVTEPHFKRGS